MQRTTTAYLEPNFQASKPATWLSLSALLELELVVRSGGLLFGFDV
jgi:hypothetical protein